MKKKTVGIVVLCGIVIFCLVSIHLPAILKETISYQLGQGVLIKDLSEDGIYFIEEKRTIHKKQLLGGWRVEHIEYVICSRSLCKILEHDDIEPIYSNRQLP